MFLAVMTLRQFERGRTQDEMEETKWNQSTKREALNAQLKETEKDKKLLVKLFKRRKRYWFFVFVSASCDLNLFQVTVAAGGLSSKCKKVHTTPLPNPTPRKQGTCSIGEKVRLPADGKKDGCMSQTLTFTPTNSSFLYLVRKTPVCFGEAPYSQRCSGKQL